MRRLVLLSALALVPAGGCHRQAAPEPQAQAANAAPAATPESHTADVTNKGKPLPAVAIKDPADQPFKLADLKGKPVLVNLWATWCVPCVKELPTLDALAARNPGLTVLAVSEDMEGRRVVTPFFQKRGLKTLKPYADPSNALLLGLKEAGLPVTILYGADGRELWRVRGDMDWTGPKAKALLAQAGV